MKTPDQKMKSIGRARRKKVEARTAGLIAEEMTLQELGQARKLTQSADGQSTRHQTGRRFPFGKA
jgi:hypothetical protein